MEQIDNLPSPTKNGIPTEAIRYCLYSRKSSEQDESQALSIESQVKEMLTIAQRDNLEIVEVKKESHSAKAVGDRLVFNEMLNDIREKKYNGIISWAPDRLSRNAGDLGKLVDLMDQGALAKIQTHGQSFTNNPNEKFLLMILCSQAKLENDNKSINVKRGLKAKCQMGWRPGVPPLGYLHDKFAEKGSKKVVLDPERAPYIKLIHEKYAYENMSARQIFTELKAEGKFKTRHGKTVPLSIIYKILKDSFYTGRFEYPIGSGNWYKGAYSPIITKTLFDATQERMKRFKMEAYQKKEFAFTKLIKCGLCESSVTAQDKTKTLSNGAVKTYIYYGCTRGKDLYCKSGYLREEELIVQLSNIVDKTDLDELGIRKKIGKEIVRFQSFSKKILGLSDQEIFDQNDVDIRVYAKYLLREGTIIEKRELLSYLKNKLILKQKQIWLSNNS